MNKISRDCPTRAEAEGAVVAIIGRKYVADREAKEAWRGFDNGELVIWTRDRVTVCSLYKVYHAEYAHGKPYGDHNKGSIIDLLVQHIWR